MSKFDALNIDTNLKEMSDKPSPPPRCEHTNCRKKLTLTSIRCKCEKYFCSAHRYESEHACTFDYRAEQKENLNKYMSTAVITKKVEVI